MPSYRDRAELIKQLSNQAYFDALKKDEPQKKDVRVGGIDGRTGRYQVLNADGGLTSNGVPTSNAAPPSDGFVRGLQSPNVNAVSLGWRKFVEPQYVPRLNQSQEAKPEDLKLISFNFTNTSGLSSPSVAGQLGEFSGFASWFIPISVVDPVIYSVPDLVLQRDSVPDPVVLPISDPFFGGIGTVTFKKTEPYITYKLDFSSYGGTGFAIQPPILIAQVITPETNFPVFTLKIKAYISVDGGAFDLVRTTTNTFNTTSQISGELVVEGVGGSVIEYYFTWEFI